MEVIKIKEKKIGSHYFINDENLKSDIKEYKIKIKNTDFSFKTDNGVFSKNKLDFGTELLIKTVIEKNIKGSILDLGCGYGVIGIILNKLFNVKTDLIDVNKRAIHLTKLNIKENNCLNVNAFISDGYNNINSKYNYIISNPPIRIGKDNLYKLIIDSKKYLEDDGCIYLVIRKEQGAKSFIKYMNVYYKCEKIEQKKGFFIICLKK